MVHADLRGSHVKRNYLAYQFHFIKEANSKKKIVGYECNSYKTIMSTTSQSCLQLTSSWQLTKVKTELSKNTTVHIFVLKNGLNLNFSLHACYVALPRCYSVRPDYWKATTRLFVFPFLLPEVVKGPIMHNSTVQIQRTIKLAHANRKHWNLISAADSERNSL